MPRFHYLESENGVVEKRVEEDVHDRQLESWGLAGFTKDFGSRSDDIWKSIINLAAEVEKDSLAESTCIDTILIARNDRSSQTSGIKVDGHGAVVRSSRKDIFSKVDKVIKGRKHLCGTISERSQSMYRQTSALYLTLEVIGGIGLEEFVHVFKHRPHGRRDRSKSKGEDVDEREYRVEQIWIVMVERGE